MSLNTWSVDSDRILRRDRRAELIRLCLPHAGIRLSEPLSLSLSLSLSLCLSLSPWDFPIFSAEKSAMQLM